MLEEEVVEPWLSGPQHARDRLLGRLGALDAAIPELLQALTGGPGADSLFGRTGLDTLIANDGVADLVISCGADPDNPAIIDVGLDPAPISCS